MMTALDLKSKVSAFNSAEWWMSGTLHLLKTLDVFVSDPHLNRDSFSFFLSFILS